MTVARWGLGLTGLALLLALAVGFLGALHPAGDSLAVFRAQVTALLALVAVLGLALGARRSAAVGLIAALAAGAPLLAAYQVPATPGALRLYQKNMLFRNDTLPALVADIRAAVPDVVTLQEVSAPNRVVLADLADILPHQVMCPVSTVGGVAVLTRLPPVPGTETCAKGLAALQVQAPQGRIWLVSVHMSWPWPYGQAAHLAVVLPVIKALEGLVAIAGDFNMVPWSHALAEVRRAARVTAAGPVRGSFPEFGRLLTLPIDHVMAPGGGAVALRPHLGSDHLGLLADLTVWTAD